MQYKTTAIISKDLLDEMTEILFAYGADSISAEFIKDDISLSAIFDNKELPIQFLKENNFIIEEFKEEDWKNRWLDDYEGTQLTNSIYIQSKTSTNNSPDHCCNVIKLNPNDAFGDGTHPTTKQCANFLELHCIKTNASNETLLDIGTGTGIFPVIAYLNGIRKIDAFDIDSDAVIRAKENAIINNCEVNIFKDDIYNYKPEKKYTIVMVNLLTKIITDTIDIIKSCGSNNSIFIISGISSIWKQEMDELFINKGFIIERFSILDEWCSYQLRLHN